jgi:hypothetical protein
MDEWWEVHVEGHKCVCEIRAGTIRASVRGKGFLYTKRGPAGTDSKAAGLALCQALIAERNPRRR